jgi:hypothetical protein
MRHFIIEICCAVAMALVASSAPAQTMEAAPSTFKDRPPPPTAASIPLAPGAALALAPFQAAPSTSKERPPPATEPSVALAATAVAPPQKAVSLPRNESTARPKADAAQPALRQKTVQRSGKGPAGPVALPPPDALVMMVRGALASANQANFTENYSVLHQLTTPALQARLNVMKFGMAFADLRKQNLDLSPTLVLPPQFTETPAVMPNGTLRLVGFFPTRPLQINFEIVYVPVNGIWSIDGLSLAAMPVGVPAADLVASASPAPPQMANSATSPVPSQPMTVRMISGTCIQQAKTFCREFPPPKLREVSVFRRV